MSDRDWMQMTAADLIAEARATKWTLIGTDEPALEVRLADALEAAEAASRAMILDFSRATEASEAEAERFRRAAVSIESEVTDILARALGYPEYEPGSPGYSPDRVNYVIGDHVSQSLAAQAANAIAEARRIAEQYRDAAFFALFTDGAVREPLPWEDER